MFCKLRKKALVWLLAACVLLIQVFSAAPALAGTTATERLAGGDRYQTAVAISQNGWKSADYAVVARGDDFADALCAGPLAAKYKGPILLTEPGSLNSDTLKELKRLGVKHLFIAGGTGAVSQRVEDALKAGGIETIERVYGTTRYDTSVKIAEMIGAKSPVALATGSDYPDALSVSVIAAKQGMPILLTEKEGLPAAVRDYFQSGAVSQTYIVGGTGVIGSSIEDSVPSPSRLAGKDRYETNIAVMQHFEKDFDFEKIYVAIGGGGNGNEFADALTGAVLAARTSSPLVLTGQTLPAGTVGYLQTKLLFTSKVTGLGGQAVVPASVLTSILIAKENLPAAEKYSAAATYGPETGSQTIAGNAIISAPDVTLRNTVIEGDLLLGQSIADGTVTLKDVTVKGKTIVNGGGPNSVILDNFKGETVITALPAGSNVRLLAQGNTSIGQVLMESKGTLEASGLTGDGFVNVVIAVEGVFADDGTAAVTLTGSFQNVTLAAGAAVQAVGTRIGQLDVTAREAVLDVDQNSTIGVLNVAETAADGKITVSGKIGTLTVNAKMSINNQGTIAKAQINVNGVAINGNAPATLKAADTVTDQPATGKAPSSGGSSGGSDRDDSSPSDTSFAGGSGTTASPYWVATAEQLDRVRNYLDQHFILTEDIDLSGYANWAPIGVFQPLSNDPEDAETPNPKVAFTGTFDGNEHTISNLTVNEAMGMGTGLFGCAAGNIHDLTVENVAVSGYFLAGGVVGYQASDCSLENVSLTGSNTVRGYQAIGGITGGGFGNLIRCDAVANIVVSGDGGCCAGVLVGGQEGNSVIDSCTAAGTVTAEGDHSFGLGGLAGQACQEGSGVTNCRAGAAITALGANNTMIGGLISYTGTYDQDSPTQVTGCSADVAITVSDSTNRVGGLIGGSFYYESYSEDNPEPTFYRVTGCATAGTITGGGREGSIGSIAGYAYCSTIADCTSTLSINGAAGNLPQVGLSETTFAGGTGTADAPYQVATAAQLNRVRNYLDRHFILTDDLNLSGYANWEPIGTFRLLSDAPEDAETADPEAAFTGTFDGNGHTISNLTVNQPAGMAAGLFGCAVGAEENPSSICNLTVENVDVTGYFMAGGVVGHNGAYFNLDNVSLTGTNTVRGFQMVGGIAGGGFGDLADCDAAADIVVLGDGGAAAGVLGGGLEGCAVTGCTATGTVTAEGDGCYGLGGLAGCVGSEGSEVANCRAGNVTITASGANNLMIGGLLGFTGAKAEDTPTPITECSADVTLVVSDSTARVGGLIGGSFYHELYASTTPVPLSYAVTGCNTSGSITGGSEAIGSIAGYAYHSTVSDCESTMTWSGGALEQVGLADPA